jgi:hypothetical protein
MPVSQTLPDARAPGARETDVYLKETVRKWLKLRNHSAPVLVNQSAVSNR